MRNETVSDPIRTYLTGGQAAAVFYLSESSIISYIRSGELKAFHVGGLRKVLNARAEMMKLLELVEPA